MKVTNYYPEFPEIAYKRTSITMANLVAYAKTLVGKYNIHVVRAAYCIWRNESANGTKGVNNNYAGIQADNARWIGLDLAHVVGTCVKVDSGNKARRFICFDEEGYKVGFEFVCSKAEERDIYFGAAGFNGVESVAVRYLYKWVGMPRDMALKNKAGIKNFKSLYNSSIKAIPSI